MQLIGPGVYQPGEVELLTSEDGESYISQGVIPTTISNTDKDLSFQEYKMCIRDSYNRGLARLSQGDVNRGIADLSKAGELGIYNAYSIIKRMTSR